MKDDNNIKSFSAGDIERYHKGLMSAKEMNALEKAAMDDPFLADALEGYAVAGVKAEDDIKNLQNRLAKRTDSGKTVGMFPPRRYYGLRVAAMIILIAGAGILAYTLLSKKNNENSIAQTKKENSPTVTPQSPDTGGTNRNEVLLADSLQGSVARVETKDRFSHDTTKSRTVNRETFNAITLKKDSIDFRTANTTRNLSSEDLEAAPVANNNPVRSLNEKKNEAKDNDSLVIVLQDRKTADKNTVVPELKEVVVSNRPDAAFLKSKKAEKYAEGRNASVSGVISNNNFKQSADSIIYSKLNIFRGRVTDASNNGISFANVTVNDVNVGTYADAKGYFSLVSPDSVLQVSLKAVGFNNSQVQLKSILPSNQVILQEDKSMDAIVMSNKKPNTNRSRSADMVLTEPEPDDGWEKYDSYLANNMKVPEAKEEIQKKGGQVELSFEVNSDGEPVNITVTKSLCKECDEEAIRLLKEGPKWKKKKKKERGKVTIAF